VRKDVLDEVGGFDTGVNAVDDYDLWLRIVLAGYTGARTQDNLVIQRERADSQSKDELMMRLALRETLVRVADSDHATPEAKTLAARRVKALDRYVWIQSGASLPARMVRSARRAAGRVRRLLKGGPGYYDSAPPEVAAAFPELERL
jgi:GT2 family glycosyltransferase